MAPPTFARQKLDLRQRAARAALWVIAVLLTGNVLALLAMTTASATEPPMAAQRYRALLTRSAQATWGLDAPIPAFAAQVQQESAWNAQAVSRVGARGLAQFMPATAKWWCELLGLKPDACQPHNPAWALRALVGYDKFLYDRVPERFGEYDRLWLALRGYNGGAAHWQAEANTTGLSTPTRAQIDAACGRARRAALHCVENLNYPARILRTLQPTYAAWGRVVEAP